MTTNIIFTYSLLFILGSFFGSFCMVVGMRVPKKESIVKPRSHCDHCGHSLSLLELIPVFSYLIQGGKCRHCGAKLSIMYPIGEALAGFAFVSTTFLFYWRPEALVGLTLFCLLFTISISDLTTYLIPNKILLFFLVVGIVERVFIPMYPWWSPILGAVLGFGILYLLGLASRGGMGGGDIKLFGVLGIYLGWQGVLLSLFISSLLGLVFGLYQRIKQGKEAKPIPFGPFIALGSWFVYFWQSGQYQNLVFMLTNN